MSSFKFTRKVLKGSFIFTTDDAVELWSLLKEVINGFNGDVEKFYSNFFSLLVTNVLPCKFDDASVTNILMSELANILLNYLVLRLLALRYPGIKYRK